MPKTLHALRHILLLICGKQKLLLYIQRSIYDALLHPRVNINNRKYTINMDERRECVPL